MVRRSFSQSHGNPMLVFQRAVALVALFLASACGCETAETPGNSLEASRPRRWRISTPTCGPSTNPTTDPFDPPSSIPSDVPSTMPSPLPTTTPPTSPTTQQSISLTEPPSPPPTVHPSPSPTVVAEVVRPLSLSDKISLIGITQIMEESRILDIPIPSGTLAGDLLLLFLHRTDDYLPWQLFQDWTRTAWCFKGNNHYNCALECVELLSSRGSHGEQYCKEFVHTGTYGEPANGNEETTSGQDLAQAVFIRKATKDDEEDVSIRVDMGGASRHPAWAMLMTLRGANATHPIRDWASTGADSHNSSIFPNVNGVPGDMILLSQSFDDQVNCPKINKFATAKEWMQSQATPNCKGEFENPKGTQMLRYIVRPNEFLDSTGFLWGGTLQSRVTADSNEYVWKTEGPGRGGNPWGPTVKDLMISLTIRPSL